MFIENNAVVSTAASSSLFQLSAGVRSEDVFFFFWFLITYPSVVSIYFITEFMFH